MHFRPLPGSSEHAQSDYSWVYVHDAIITPLQTTCLLSAGCNRIQNNYIRVGQGARIVPGAAFNGGQVMD